MQRQKQPDDIYLAVFSDASPLQNALRFSSILKGTFAPGASFKVRVYWHGEYFNYYMRKGFMGSFDSADSGKEVKRSSTMGAAIYYLNTVANPAITQIRRDYPGRQYCVVTPRRTLRDLDAQLTSWDTGPSAPGTNGMFDPLTPHAGIRG